MQKVWVVGGGWETQNTIIQYYNTEDPAVPSRSQHQYVRRKALSMQIGRGGTRDVPRTAGEQASVGMWGDWASMLPRTWMQNVRWDRTRAMGDF